MPKVVAVAACTAVVLLAGCGRPDGQALQRLACEQVTNSIDLQSVSQLDALRKALGVAPGVDPLQTCRALGVTMEPNPQGGGATEEGNSMETEGVERENREGNQSSEDQIEN
jgi:hypothetical protein